MGAEMRLTDNVSQTFSAMTNSTNEFRSSIEPTERAVSSMTTAVSSGTQDIQNFADTLTETATATDSVVASTQQATQGTNKWKAAIQQFNRGTETLKNLPHTLKQVASQRLDGLQNSFISTRLQAGLLVGGVKALAREKVTSLVNNFKEFKNTVTESKGGLSGFATGLKNISKISIANTFNAVKNLTNKTKEFAATKLSGITNKFKEFKTRATGGETGVKGLWNATKNFANTSLTGIHNSIKKVGDLAVTAGKRVTQHLGGAFKSIGKGLGNLSVGMVKGFGVAVAGLGTAAIAASAGIFKLTNMASDLDETLNKVDVAFGESSQAVKKWSENSIKDMGLSKQTALDMTALFGDMGTSMGIPQKQAANMSMSLTQLGADLASFKNIDIAQATTALNGVFTGETESLKMLGIVMTQTNLDAFALAKGFGKTTKEMTEAEKVNLRYAYVMEKTKNAQGDFVRTGGGFANQWRVFKETIKEIGTNMGTIFIPSLTKGLQTLNKFGAEINNVFKDGWQDGDDKKLADIFTRMVDKGVTALSSGLPKIVNTIVPIVNTLAGAFLKALPNVVPVLMNGATTIFRSIIDLIKQNKEPLINLAVNVVTNLVSFLLEAIPELVLVGADMIVGFVQGIAKQLPTIVPQAVKAIETLINGLMANLDAIIIAGIDILNGLIDGLIQNLPLLLNAAMKLILSVVTGLLNNIQLIINCALNLVQALVTGLIQNIPMLLQGALQLIMGIVNGLVSNINLIIDGALALVNALILGIVQNLPAIIQAAVQVVIALAIGLIQAIPQLIAAVPRLVSGIIDTILSTNWLEVGWEIVKGIGKGLWDGVKSIFGGGGKEGGEAAANGAASGLTSNIGTISTASQTAANSITTGLQPDFTAINGYGVTATTGLATGLTDGATGLNTAAMQLGTDASTNIATGLTSGTDTVNMAATQLGTNTVTGLSTGITDSIGLATDAANNTATVVTDTFKGIDLYDCGTNAMQGFINGINAMRSSVMSAANSIANSVKSTINSALDIHSPSRVMEESGEFTGEGLVLGITKMIDKVKSAAQGLSDSTVEPFATRTTNVQAISPTGLTQVPAGKREGLKIAIENIILQDVGDKDPKALVAEILQLLYDALSGADEVLSAGEMGALL